MTVETTGMGELWIAFGFVALLGALAGSYALEPTTLLLLGFWVTLGGLVFGLPTGALYHVLLYRSLTACGRLPAGRGSRRSPARILVMAYSRRTM